MSEVRKVYQEYKQQLLREHPNLFRKWEGLMERYGI